MASAGDQGTETPVVLQLEQCRTQWLTGQWEALLAISPEDSQRDAASAEMAALQASAAARTGDHAAALAHATWAQDAGLPAQEIARLWLAGAWDSLGRAAWLTGQSEAAATAFQAAVLPLAATAHAQLSARAARQAAAERAWHRALKSQSSRKPWDLADAQAVPAWLQQLADRCLASADLHDEVDHLLERLLQEPEDRVWLMIALDERLRARGDTMSALHFLRTAMSHAAEISPRLRRMLVRRLAHCAAAEAALDLTVETALDDPVITDAETAALLQMAFRKLRQVYDARIEHGHALLLQELQDHMPVFKERAEGRPLTVIEIGTTREDVPGQGSTRHLAEFCRQHQLRFVTVDMDPHNSRMARSAFRRLGVPQFEAITAKGEEYLRALPGPIDFVFLDAYDYDHGKHSQLRQTRYEKYLGSRIDEKACHAMHLDCAQSLSGKLWQHGRICVDDTWLEDGRWTAKGTTAMPYLLSQGFELVAARNRAALLKRHPGDGSAAP